MPTSSFDHPLFGQITFRTASARWVRGDQIFFISGFDEREIVPVQIPQLTNVPGSNGGRLGFYRKGHTQLLRAFEEIERKGLLRHIKTCAGSFNRRLRKPTSGGLSKLPSNHAFGIAIDLNSDDGSNGASVAPVAPVFQAHGFTWGLSFNDPMHFEVRQFMQDAFPMRAEDGARDGRFVACRQKVYNRGRAPEAFLATLVDWGRSAGGEIFARNNAADIYSSVVGHLGPWRDDLHRRAVMLEVLRVLGGFESSWNWSAGRDITNPGSGTPCTEEAGIFQCSGNSMSFDPSLRQLLIDAGGTPTCESFIEVSKANHIFALEYCARLLRLTTKHHGPIKNRHIHAWLRRDAVDELRGALGLT